MSLERAPGAQRHRNSVNALQYYVLKSKNLTSSDIARNILHKIKFSVVLKIVKQILKNYSLS